jgi:hypothetical protein
MRNRRLVLAVTIALGTVVTVAGPASATPPTCNWGKLTSSSIAAGFGQGAHASSESTPRDGLANVLKQGDLNATCEYIASQP